MFLSVNVALSTFIHSTKMSEVILGSMLGSVRNYLIKDSITIKEKTI